MDRPLAATIAYSRSRVQFGQPIGLAAAKVLIGQSARFIGQQAVQLHGGTGMTDELDVSHYFKRLLAFEIRCGTTQDHLEIYQRSLRVS